MTIYLEYSFSLFLSRTKHPAILHGNFSERLSFYQVNIFPRFIFFEEAEMLGGGGGRAAMPQSLPGCVRLPYLYVKNQEGGGVRRTALSLSPLAYDSPTAQTIRGRPT